MQSNISRTRCCCAWPANPLLLSVLWWLDSTEQLLTQCLVLSGVAYDGYLTSCNIFIDADSNGVRGASDPQATSTNGAFSLDIFSLDSLAGQVRLEPAPGNAVAAVPAGSPVCYDIATMLPERLPLAAPVPDSCDPGRAPTAVTAASTLLVSGVELTPSQLATAFGLDLPAGASIGRYNALQVRAHACLHSCTGHRYTVQNFLHCRRRWMTLQATMPAGSRPCRWRPPSAT